MQGVKKGCSAYCTVHLKEKIKRKTSGVINFFLSLNQGGLQVEKNKIAKCKKGDRTDA